MGSHYAWVTILGEAVVAIGVLVAGLRVMLSIIHRIDRFLDEWNGTDNRPGVMKRLDTLEDGQVRIMREVMPNGGQSLRDKVDRIEKKLGCPG